jgi:peptidoglycan/LPS O-acetylase OafA/YrhL
LLFLRTRWGWGRTIIICLLARLGWIFFSHAIWVATGVGVPVPEAAASHWFTWALGAIGVEAAFGLVQLPRWCRSLWLASALIIGASVISQVLPGTDKNTLFHNVGWFLMHPAWGLGFFILVNRAVGAEREWLRQLRLPALISIFATLGVFSYSIYLTHELVVMESWQLISPSLAPMLNTFLIVTPAVIFFAWIFFWFCEKPYMRKRTRQVRSSEFTPSPVPTESMSVESVSL